MTARTGDMRGLQRAKQALAQKYGKRAWFRGVGIAPSESGLVLRLNVDPTSEASKEKIPRSFRGYKVEIVFIRGYKPRQG